MGLTYPFEFRAPRWTPAAELEAFLHGVRRLAESLGFHPTAVLNIEFDTPERQDFSRRLSRSLVVADERLKGIPVPAPRQVWDLNPVTGECRVIPEHGVVLVVTGEHGEEACFGFLRYPREILDIQGKVLVDSELPEGWYFRDHLKTPDPRVRRIVAMFREAGYVADEKDDYAR